jgi:hypothetical protein
MTMHEVQVFTLFLLLIGLWFFKTPLFMPGWGDVFDVRMPHAIVSMKNSADSWRSGKEY